MHAARSSHGQEVVVRSEVVETSFGFYSDEEKKTALSVCRVEHGRAEDENGKPIDGGLYDARMGPSSHLSRCATCGLKYVNCPGHPGHVELEVPVYNTLLFATMFQLLRAKCSYCHRLKMSDMRVHLYYLRLRLLEMGEIDAADNLFEELVFSASSAGSVFDESSTMKDRAHFSTASAIGKFQQEQQKRLKKEVEEDGGESKPQSSTGLISSKNPGNKNQGLYDSTGATTTTTMTTMVGVRTGHVDIDDKIDAHERNYYAFKRAQKIKQQHRAGKGAAAGAEDVRLRTANGVLVDDVIIRKKQAQVIDEFQRATLLPKKCENCGAHSPPFRKDGHAKIFQKPMPKRQRAAAAVMRLKHKSALEIASPSPSRPNAPPGMSISSMIRNSADMLDAIDAADTDDESDGEEARDTDKYLVPLEVEAQLKLLWERNGDILEYIHGRGRGKVAHPSRDVSSSSPSSMENKNFWQYFFTRVLLVTPNRFRPVSKIGETSAEHPQNIYLKTALECNEKIRDIQAGTLARAAAIAAAANATTGGSAVTAVIEEENEDNDDESDDDDDMGDGTSSGGSGDDDDDDDSNAGRILVPKKKENSKKGDKNKNNSKEAGKSSSSSSSSSLTVHMTKVDAAVAGSLDLSKLVTVWIELQHAANSYVDSSKNPNKLDVVPMGIRQILERKEGLFRKNMMGKRVNYCCRSVISPDPYLGTDEIGIPMRFAMTLQYPVPVNDWNVKYLRTLVERGPFEYPGANQIELPDGRIIKLEKLSRLERAGRAKLLLQGSTGTGGAGGGAAAGAGGGEGAVDTSSSGGVAGSGCTKVYRHLINGDVVLMNRQPTLHKPGIMAHKVRILEHNSKEQTIRMNYANCNAYNADFDGDEMNCHFVQNDIARAEATSICNTDNQYMVPTSGTPLRGLIQDHVVSGVKLTNKNCFLTLEEFQQLLFVALGGLEGTEIVGYTGKIRIPAPAIVRGCVTRRNYGDRGTLLSGASSARKIGKQQQRPQNIDITGPLWTGKQVISALLRHLCAPPLPSLFLTAKARTPANLFDRNLPCKRHERGSTYGEFSSCSSTSFASERRGGRGSRALDDGFTLTEKDRAELKQGVHAADEWDAENKVLIRDGQLLRGVIDKASIGNASLGVVHSVYELYGAETAGKLLTSFGRLFTYYLQDAGQTCGIGDLTLTQQVEAERAAALRAVSKEAEMGLSAYLREQLGSALQNAAYVDLTEAEEELSEGEKLACARRAATLLFSPSSAAAAGEAGGLGGSTASEAEQRRLIKAELDSSMQGVINKAASSVIKICLPLGLEVPFPRNNFSMMVSTGAKGSAVNQSQISCFLGQQALEGQRVPIMVSGKSLPSFRAFDMSARAGGFVRDRFLTGVKPQEYYFHCMAGREGLVDTAVKTSRSGYLQRCLVKHLEELRIHYDMTVRDSGGNIVQFLYGEDGLDPVHAALLGGSDAQMQFMAQNNQALVHKFAMHSGFLNQGLEIETASRHRQQMQCARELLLAFNQKVYAMLHEQRETQRAVLGLISPAAATSSQNTWSLKPFTEAERILSEIVRKGSVLLARKRVSQEEPWSKRGNLLQDWFAVEVVKIRSAKDKDSISSSSEREKGGLVFDLRYCVDGLVEKRVPILQWVSGEGGGGSAGLIKGGGPIDSAVSSIARMVQQMGSGGSNGSNKPLPLLLIKPGVPDPAMSSLRLDSAVGACSELVQGAIEDYTASNPEMFLQLHDSTDALSAARARKHDHDITKIPPESLELLVWVKFLRSLAAPGEAVGCIAAQSVGEPSTQMTLNTFHLAGHGGANVTLGIPRLREIIMTASKSLKTPTMTFPLKPGFSMDAGKALARKLSRLTLSELLHHDGGGIEVGESIAYSEDNMRWERVYRIKLQLQNVDKICVAFGITFEVIVMSIKTVFFAKLAYFIKQEQRHAGQKFTGKNDALRQFRSVSSTSVADLADGGRRRGKEEDGEGEDSQREDAGGGRGSRGGGADFDAEDDDPAGDGKKGAGAKKKKQVGFAAMLDSDSEEEEEMDEADVQERAEADGGGEFGDSALSGGVKKEVTGYEEEEEEEKEEEEQGGGVKGRKSGGVSRREQDKGSDSGGEEGASDNNDSDMEVGGGEETRRESTEKKIKLTRVGSIGGGGGGIKGAGDAQHGMTYNREDGWVEFTLSFAANARRLLMTLLVEKAAAQSMVRSTKGITKAYSVPYEAPPSGANTTAASKTSTTKHNGLDQLLMLTDSAATGEIGSSMDGGGDDLSAVGDVGLQTEGVNFEAIWGLSESLISMNDIRCNDIHQVLLTYGVEAARQCIVSEITAVFGVYGINVNPRHLSLIADFMTRTGSYLAMSRIGMADAAGGAFSPFLQMSFETTCTFLTQAAQTGKTDNMQSPSARIVLGSVPKVGTGCFDLMQPLPEI